MPSSAKSFPTKPRRGSTAVQVRAATVEDAGALCAIYNPYVVETTITFEESAVAEGAMRQRIADVTAAYPWLVAHAGERVAGYAYAAAWARPTENARGGRVPPRIDCTLPAEWL